VAIFSTSISTNCNVIKKTATYSCLSCLELNLFANEDGALLSFTTESNLFMLLEIVPNEKVPSEDKLFSIEREQGRVCTIQRSYVALIIPVQLAQARVGSNDEQDISIFLNQ
jgi:hypothetical protein